MPSVIPSIKSTCKNKMGREKLRFFAIVCVEIKGFGESGAKDSDEFMEVWMSFCKNMGIFAKSLRESCNGRERGSWRRFYYF
jgi:hypothetical protein